MFDMSTAAIALFGVLTCKAKGQPLPPQSAYDANGNWTRKVEDIHIGGGGGAIANFGGHKGTGLALMVELLCAALAGGAVLGQDVKKTAKNWGHHVIAIDPDAMTDGFAGRAASIIKTVAASHADGVRLPGDSSNAIAAKNKNAGAIPVPKRIWDVITATAAKAWVHNATCGSRDPREARASSRDARLARLSTASPDCSWDWMDSSSASFRACSICSNSMSASRTRTVRTWPRVYLSLKVVHDGANFLLSHSMSTSSCFSKEALFRRSAWDARWALLSSWGWSFVQRNKKRRACPARG